MAGSYTLSGHNRLNAGKVKGLSVLKRVANNRDGQSDDAACCLLATRQGKEFKKWGLKPVRTPFNNELSHAGRVMSTAKANLD